MAGDDKSGGAGLTENCDGIGWRDKGGDFLFIQYLRLSSFHHCCYIPFATFNRLICMGECLLY